MNYKVLVPGVIQLVVQAHCNVDFTLDPLHLHPQRHLAIPTAEVEVEQETQSQCGPH